MVEVVDRENGGSTPEASLGKDSEVEMNGHMFCVPQSHPLLQEASLAPTLLEVTWWGPAQLLQELKPLLNMSSGLAWPVAGSQ